MTISTAYVPNIYAGDGSTVSFAITFAYLSTASNVKVSLKNDSTGVITEQVSATHYNLSGANVVFVTAPSTGTTVLIELNVPFLQETDYRENGSLPAEVLEADLDRRTLESQLNKVNADAALRLDPAAAASLTSNIIAASSVAANNANKFVRFTEDGTGFEVKSLADTAGMIDVVDDTSPQLGGDLDLNGNDITGTGNILLTGSMTVTGTVDGRDVSVDGIKLDGITAGADPTISTLNAATLTGVTVATGDLVLIKDISDSNALRSVTAQSIANLAAASSGPAVRAYRNTSTQSISAATATKIQLNGESFDTASAFDSTTNYRFQPATSGYYQVTGTLYVTGTSLGTISCRIYKNGTADTVGTFPPAGTTSGSTCVSSLIYLNGSSDYLELYTVVSSGTGIVVQNGAEFTYMTAVFIRS